jgi:hypothetical protein
MDAYGSASAMINLWRRSPPLPRLLIPEGVSMEHRVVRRPVRWLRQAVTLGCAVLIGSTMALVAADPAAAAIGAVRGVASGRCLDVPSSSTANGTQVDIWGCNSGTNQEWNYTSSKQLQVYGNKCLDAYNSGATAGTKVVIWDCNGQSNQQWNVTNGGTITNVASGLCLDAVSAGTVNGTLVDLWTCNGGTNQKWNVTVGSAGCPGSGGITYTMNPASPTNADESDAYARITAAMNLAVAEYNCYLSVSKALTVNYIAGDGTADGNYNGTIRFFKGRDYMVQATAQHEIAHTLGVGTTSNWSSFSKNGVWTGSNGINQLRTLTGNASAVLSSDTQHFWPYGLNQASEATSADDYIFNVKMVAALRKDMGL